MKKILMILAVLFILAVPNIKVLALEDSFYEGEYIPGEYIKKFRNGAGKYEQLRFFRRKSDNRAVYCIELWEAISSNKLIPGYDNDQYLHSNMDYSNWERVMLISYYGYGYQNHTEDKWYVVTQFMIWKELSSDTNLYFTDKLNGNKIEKYEAEMNEINNLIQNHSNIPSIYNQTYQVKYKEPLIIKDTNNVLEKFNITGGNEFVTKKEKNTLTIMKNTIGESQIIFSNTDNMYSSRPIVYIDENGQNLLAAGSYYPIYMVVNVNLPYKNIKVIKRDKETSNLSQGDANLIGSKIQLLDKDYQLIAEKEITDDHSLVFDNVPYGTYYLKEVTPGNGYLLNKALKSVIPDTFNMISVDRDTSTNDTVLLLANGLAGNDEIVKEDEDYQTFKEALYYVNEYLAKCIASDGEGATKLLEINVNGAKDVKQAKVVAKSVCTSPLVKTAIFGNDANWGRLLCAMGYSGEEFDPYQVDLYIESEFGNLKPVENGMATDYSEEKATQILSSDYVKTNIDMKMGNEKATAWGCDLTYDYVKINADYRS